MNRWMNRSLSLSFACLFLASMAPPPASPASARANLFGSAACQVSCPAGYRGACGVSGCSCSCGCASADAIDGLIQGLRGKGLDVFEEEIDPAVILNMGDKPDAEALPMPRPGIEPATPESEETRDLSLPETTTTSPTAVEKTSRE